MKKITFPTLVIAIAVALRGSAPAVVYAPVFVRIDDVSRGRSGYGSR